MNSPLLYVPGWLGIFRFILCFLVSIVGNKTSFATTMDIACQMVKELSCDERFIHSIATLCEHLRPRYEAATTHGMSCRRNDECSVQESVCHYDVCLCEPGLYFSPKKNNCLRRCAEYGHEMDLYKNICISYHNTKGPLRNTTLARCRESCIHEKTFTCLTVDWYEPHRYCYLSNVGYLSVSPSLRERGLGWDLAQRRCK